jgi:hypothetical protein
MGSIACSQERAEERVTSLLSLSSESQGCPMSSLGREQNVQLKCSPIVEHDPIGKRCRRSATFLQTSPHCSLVECGRHLCHARRPRASSITTWDFTRTYVDGPMHNEPRCSQANANRHRVHVQRCVSLLLQCRAMLSGKLGSRAEAVHSQASTQQYLWRINQFTASRRRTVTSPSHGRAASENLPPATCRVTTQQIIPMRPGGARSKIISERGSHS